jgi:hypothetical protein
MDLFFCTLPIGSTMLVFAKKFSLYQKGIHYSELKISENRPSSSAKTRRGPSEGLKGKVSLVEFRPGG